MKACPMCGIHPMLYPQKLCEGTMICAECFLSPAVKFCAMCGEYFSYQNYTVEHQCCTGCYDSRKGAKEHAEKEKGHH